MLVLLLVVIVMTKRCTTRTARISLMRLNRDMRKAYRRGPKGVNHLIIVEVPSRIRDSLVIRMLIYFVTLVGMGRLVVVTLLILVCQNLLLIRSELILILIILVIWVIVLQVMFLIRVNVFRIPVSMCLVSLGRFLMKMFLIVKGVLLLVMVLLMEMFLMIRGVFLLVSVLI